MIANLNRTHAKANERNYPRVNIRKPFDGLLSGFHEDCVLTIDDVSEMFDVSAKTVTRWRDDGLVAGKLEEDGRVRTGFLQSSVEKFVRQNPGRVQRGSSFRRMTDDERCEIIESAEKLRHEGHTAAEIVKAVAHHSARSVETIRYTLKRHDKDHPEQAILAKVAREISKKQKQIIYAEYRKGDSAATIAGNRDLSIAKVRRCIRELRVERILEIPLDYIDSNEFRRPGAEKRILSECPQASKSARKRAVPGNLPPYLASLYETPLLTPAQELHLFRKYNFLKYQATTLRSQLDVTTPTSRLLGKIERFYEQAIETKNQIIKANLRLVVSVVKVRASDNADLFDRISSGNVSLMKAIEKFDYSRGFKFSTYATWAIKRNSARDFADDMRRSDRFKTGREPALHEQVETRSDPQHDEAAYRVHKEQVSRLMTVLNDRERQVISSRFGLARGDEPKTLKKVGEETGVSKERIRQIEVRAMTKLREAASENGVEMFGEI